MWIDVDDTTAVGTIGFRVEAIDNNHGGRSRWTLRDEPLRTNQSLEPRLHGWCGETDNVSRFARGLVRVERLNKARTRALVTPVVGGDLATALEEFGYPGIV